MANVIYANARAKALENGLLSVDRLNRMLDSGSPDEAMKVLAEVNFGGGVSIDSFMKFETLISAEEKKFISFIKADCPSQAFKNYMLLPFDFHNAEAFIKEKYLKRKADDFTVDSGMIEKESMKEKIMLDEYKDFPDEMAKALITCDSDFVSGKATGASVNSVFKKALYKELYKNAKKGELNEIFNIKADCANIGVALRVRNFSQAKEFFVSGGKLTETELKTLSEESFELIKEKCKFMSCGELISVAVDSCIKDEPLSAFETLADDFALKFLKKKKYATDGIVPFMLYCYYKLAEIKNVRIVMVGLINGMDKNEIKRRLREGYEG
ncbi:MAG: V-type ATPase subunit [Clostridia bacterium]|nr:V-type ATPase subunit [Clostridia bacterium]